MVNRLRSLLVKALVGVFVAGVALPAALQAQSPVKRFSAEFLNWDGTESVTDLAVPGIAVYDKTLTFGSDVNTVYVTFSGTADSHAGNAEWLECTIDGTPCNPGHGGAAGAPDGWLSVSKHFNYDNVTYNGGVSGGDGGGGNGDMHDNSIIATWCSPITPGTHTIEIRMASSLTGGGVSVDNNVFFEAAHVYIDGSKPLAGSACVKAAPPSGAAPDRPSPQNHR